MDPRFVKKVREIDEDVTSDELADMVWLAAHMSGAPGARRGAPSRPPPRKQPSGSTTRSSPAKEQPPGQGTRSSQRETPLEEHSSAEFRLPRVSDQPAGQPGVHIRSPAVPAIPNELAISRALSPLQRRAPSTSRTTPDEAGTATLIAETDLWTPKVVPVLERWLEVALVVDDSASMAMWQRALVELRILLERTGAFRDIRVWYLDGDLQHGDTVSIASAVGKDRSRRNPSELVNQSGRRLVIIASDCVGSAWIHDSMSEALTLWASQGPTAIVHMLPQRLWEDCAPEFYPVRMRASGPGAPNSALTAEGLYGDTTDYGIAIPALELEDRWLRPWAKLVAGTAGGWVNGLAVFTKALRKEVEQPSEFQYDRPLEQIRQFRAQASPTAYQLATFFAAGAPLTLRVMRLVQGAMLPSSKPAHLAEVFLSGLLRRVDDSGEPQSPDQDDVEYEFRPGVRDRLLEELPRPAALQVLATVSNFVSHRLGSPLDFRALLTSAELPSSLALSPPFAHVAFGILKSLGGRYADAAERLALSSSRASVTPSSGVRYNDQPLADQPGDDVTTVRPASAPERGQQEMPKIMRGVPGRNPRFTGRSDLLRDLHNLLVSSTERAALLPHTLHGLGGVGKTQLAIEFVHRFAHEYDLICWLPAQDIPQVRSSLVELGHAMGLPDNPNVQRAIEAVLDALRTGEPYRRWLLVFDNADQPEELRPYLPYPTGHVLVTSRNAGWSEVANAFEIDVFTKAESIALLRQRVPAISDDDAYRLAERLGNLPLALDQAGAWQAQTGMQVDEYLRLFEEQFERLTAHPAGEYPTPVGATYALTLDRLREQSPGAAQLLDVCAFFGAEPISVSLLRAGRHADLPAQLAQTLRDEILLRRALREIGKYALARVDSGKDQISVHRLVQVVLRSRLDETEFKQTKLAAQHILAEANPEEPDLEKNWARHAELSPHIVPADLIDADEERIRKVVVDQIRYLWSRGDYESSEELGRITVERWRERWGDDDGLSLLSRRHLAVTLITLGAYEEARALAEDTLAQFRRTLGDDSEHTLFTADTVAWAQRISGKYQEARQLDEDNLTSWRAVYGNDYPQTLKAANNFAIDLRWLGDFNRAREVDEESVEQRRVVYGEENRNTQLAVSSLARDHYGLGNYTIGLEKQERALDIQRRLLGPAHAEVLVETRNLVVLLRKVGHHARARELAMELVRTYEQRFGLNDEPTLAANVGYVNALRATGQLDDALKLGRDVLSRYRKAFGSEHPATLMCATNVAIVLRHQESAEEALALNETTLAVFRRVLGDDHPFTLCCATNTANDLASLRRHGAARELSEDTLRRSLEVRNADHPYTLACKLNVALDRRATGESAEPLLGEAVSGFKRRLGENHPETLEAMAGRHADCDIEPPET